MARNKKQLPLLEKVTITDVAAEGKAIARVNEKVVFVPFVAPGDVVDIQLTRKKNSYAEGKAVYFHEYSPERAVPFCEHFGVCGGCKWQHLPYEDVKADTVGNIILQPAFVYIQHFVEHAGNMETDPVHAIESGSGFYFFFCQPFLVGECEFEFIPVEGGAPYYMS